MKWIIIIIFVTVATLLFAIIMRTLFCKKPIIKQGPKVNLKINQEIAIHNLSQVIQCETITNNPGEDHYSHAFIQLHEFLTKTYPQVFKYLELQTFGQFTMLLKWRGKDPSLKPNMFIAHQDVVPIPPNELPEWRFPPFSGEVAEGYIWGRGALDMKSTLVALFEAVNHLISENFKPDRTLYLYLGDDEEIGGPTAKLAAEYLAAQKVQLSYIIDEGGAILDNMVPGVNKPIGLIGVSQKGQLILELSVKSESGHAAKPPKSTPIDMLSSAVAKLKQNDMPIHSDSLVFSLFNKLAPYMPWIQRAIMANLWLFKPLVSAKLQKNTLMNAMLRSTGVPTLFNAGVKQNVIPEAASATFNYRLYPGDTKDTVLNHVNKILKNSEVRSHVISDFNATSISKTDSFGFKVISETIQQVSAEPVIIAPVLTIGGTDSRHFEKFCDNTFQLLYMQVTMDDLKGYHGMNERISVKNYLNSIQFYYQLIKNSQRNCGDERAGNE